MMARPPITRANPYTPRRGQLAGITFTSDRQYRNALARLKGFRSWEVQRAAAKPPSSIAAWERMRPAERQAAHRALEAISDMRSRGLTIRHAAAQNGTTVAAIKRYGAPALTKDTRGRIRPTPSDRLLRRLNFMTPRGPIPLDIRDSRSASKVSAHARAVDGYLKTGNERALRRFQGKGVTVNKRFYPFVTDPETLDRLEGAGEVSYEDLYVDVA